MSDKVYDLSQLEELAGGSQEFVFSMVETFLEHTPGQLDELTTAFRSGDMSAMGGLAHKIKPNVDLFGISEIKEDIRAIEAMGKEGAQSPDLPAKVGRVEATLKKAFEQLEALKNS
jgi:HPt (histidine-containing phosphotransfer) domain-containing protein